jgi:hypothetical protein
VNTAPIIEFEGREYLCLLDDGIVCQENWAKTSARVVNLLKQPKEANPSLRCGARDKAWRVEKGEPSGDGQGRNLWANLMRWNAAVKRLVEGRSAPWIEFKDVKGPNVEFANALRTCALFNLDYTFPVDHEKKRNSTRDDEFNRMAWYCAPRQIPRILEAIWPKGGLCSPCIVICCGPGICGLLKELVKDHRKEYEAEFVGQALVLRGNRPPAPACVIDWYHPSCRKDSEKLFAEFQDKIQLAVAGTN